MNIIFYMRILALLAASAFSELGRVRPLSFDHIKLGKNTNGISIFKNAEYSFFK